ncbi:MAG: ankyrin repeat domain-containing protein [Planctomycetota bacterium]
MHGRNALMEAVERHDADMVKDLLEAGADPNITNKVGETAVMMAASQYIDIVKLLVEFGADVTISTKRGKTALSVAAWAERPDILSALGHDPATHEEASALMLGLKLLRTFTINEVRTLLQRGADPNVTAPDGSRPLVQMAGRGSTDKVTLLLASGADPDVIDYKKNMTAMAAAIKNEHFDTAALLYASGANPYTGGNRSALYVASKMGFVQWRYHPGNDDYYPVFQRSR